MLAQPMKQQKRKNVNTRALGATSFLMLTATGQIFLLLTPFENNFKI
jgi:hypothetical protein